MNIQEHILRAIQSLQVSILKGSGFRYRYIDTKKKETPRVDLDGKVLYVPVFGDVDDKDNDLIRYFNIHELAHCKYTNGNMESGWTTLKRDLVNSIEDLRIERAISRDELGLNKIVKDGQLECFKRYSEFVSKEKNPIRYAIGKCQFMSMGYEVIGDNKDGEKIYERIYDLYDSWKKLSNTYGNGTMEVIGLADEIIKLIEKMKQEHKDEKTPEQKEQERKDKEEKKKKKEEQKKKQKEDEREKGDDDSGDGDESGEGDEEESESGKPKKSKKGKKEKKAGKDKAGRDDKDGEESDEEGEESDEEGEEQEQKSSKPADDDSLNWDDEETEEGKNGEGEESEEGEEGEKSGKGEKADGEGDADGSSDGEGGACGEDEGGGSMDGKAVEAAMDDYETKGGAVSTADRLLKEIMDISSESVDETDYLAYKDEDIYNTDLSRNDRSYNNSYGEITSVVRKIQMVLEQALKAKAMVRKMDHQNKGKLDTKRLHAISKNLDKNIFYKQSEGESMNTCVQLVVDESGSMGGTKSSISRSVAIAFAECLSKMKIPFEILGYTTVGWAGREISPFHRTLPIRLDVFKGFSEQYESVKTKLGNMEGQNHNVDGDSLRMCWARAKVRRERRKVMLVMSDGMPEDDRSGSGRLASDLVEAVKHIRKDGGEVYGFGITTSEPQRFYGKDNFLYVGKVEELGNDFFKRLSEIIIK